MVIDNYNLHRYLLMCMDAYNSKAMSIDDYGLYGSFKYFYIMGMRIDDCGLYEFYLNV